VAHAAGWDAAGAGPLLDWLDIPRRHHLADDAADGDLRGLVLLDLPDHDSTTVAHRLEWTGSSGWWTCWSGCSTRRSTPTPRSTTATSRPWRTTARSWSWCSTRPTGSTPRTSPARSWTCAGCSPRTAYPTSRCSRRRPSRARAWTRYGPCWPAAVAAHRAAQRRISADLDGVGAGVAAVVGGPARADGDGGARHALTAALGSAAGVPPIGAAVEQAAVHRAVASTGFPFTRWLRRLRPDPLRRLHLDRARTPPSPRLTATSHARRSARPCPRPAPWNGHASSWPCAVS